MSKTPKTTVLLFGDVSSELRQAKPWLDCYQVPNIFCGTGADTVSTLAKLDNNVLIIIDAMNRNENFVKVIKHIREHSAHKTATILLLVKSTTSAINTLLKRFNISQSIKSPLSQSTFLKACTPYIQNPKIQAEVAVEVTTPTPTPAPARSKTAASPFKNSRLLITTADARLLAAIQNFLKDKFAVIEFTQDSHSAYVRLQDAYAPAIHMIIIDQQALRPRDLPSWKRTISRMTKPPVMFYMQREFDIRALRATYKLGCNAVLYIEQTPQEMAATILRTTGNLACKPKEVIPTPEYLLTERGIPLIADISEVVEPINKPEEPKIVKCGLSDLEIPILPEHLAKLKAMLQEGTPDIKKVADQIHEDQLLEERVLKIANSVYYGAMSKASTIDRAVSRIGMREFKKVVSGVLLQRSFSKLLLDKSDFCNRMWKYLVASGVAFSTVYQVYQDQFGELFPDDPYFVGVANRGGMFLLYNRYFQYQAVVAEMTDYDISGEHQNNWEVGTFGVGSVEIGAAIAMQWQISDAICHANTFFVDSTASNSSDKNIEIIANLFNLASYFAAPFMYEIDNDDPQAVLKTLAGAVNLSFEDLDAMHNQIDEDIRRYQDIFSRK